jgi:hypothetical protein
MLDLNSKIALPDDKEYDYFRDRILSDWNFNKYKEYELSNKYVKPKLQKVISRYKQCLQDINAGIKYREINTYIDDLLKDVDNNKIKDKTQNFEHNKGIYDA